MPYVVRFSQNFLLARWSVSYLLMYTWHTLLHYPHGANAGCDLAGVAPAVPLIVLAWAEISFCSLEHAEDGHWGSSAATCQGSHAFPLISASSGLSQCPPCQRPWQSRLHLLICSPLTAMWSGQSGQEADLSRIGSFGSRADGHWTSRAHQNIEQVACELYF